MHQNPIDIPVAESVHPASSARRQSSWRRAIGVLMTLGILVLAYFKRAWLLQAISLAQAAQPAWLLLGLVMSCSAS